MQHDNNLSKLAKLIRYYILVSTTTAGSGHPTTSLSATELMTVLYFAGILRADLADVTNLANDRVVFSKGHASPLFYALYRAAGVVSEAELLELRKFNSVLEGHPTTRFKYTEASTGSLGQGLSIGLGLALAQRQLFVQNPPRTFVLLGDSEMAEGQVWEAMQIASYYKTDNLLAIVDVNRLGQRGETMLGWNVEAYCQRAQAFGWKAFIVADGHNLDEIEKTYLQALKVVGKPVMIIAKTIKGKGVSFLEDKDGWHGKVLNKEELNLALAELGDIDKNIKGVIKKPQQRTVTKMIATEDKVEGPNYQKGEKIATREAYGDALVSLGKTFADVVVLDAEVSNSTFADKFKKVFPERFYEMFIAEQNMIGVAVGFAKFGFVPFVSSFAAFLTRAFDQLRMGQYNNSNLKVVGSHAGVSIGEDGPSQMGLEDLAMLRSILKSTVLYPADAVATFKLLKEMYKQPGLVYLRTTRAKTPVIYSSNSTFKIGGSQVLFESDKDRAVVFAAGITLFEALKAYDQLDKQGIKIAVVDLYSIKPLDTKTIIRLSEKNKNVVIVEDHYPYGGIGEAVKSVLSGRDVKIVSLSVNKIPRSGTTKQLFAYEEIDADSIVKAVKNFN